MATVWKKQAYAMALLDEEFLATLLEQHQREIYARIASLDINELPIEQIEGKVTGGSINIDGSSAVRRTCSLTMIAEDVNFHDYYWGLRTKFKLEIGIRNNLEGSYSPDVGIYPDIVWFPEGIFIISSFNTSLSVSSYSISITGKDKMSMLNGELGGSLFASIDFGQEEYKKKIFTKVNTTGIASSETLLGKEYYKMVDFNNNKYGQHINNANKLFYKVQQGSNTYTYEEVGENDAFSTAIIYYDYLQHAVTTATARKMFNLFPEGDVYDTDENYSFVEIDQKVSYQTDEECIGKFYKSENVYKQVVKDRYYSAVYTPYQIINTPEDLFEKVIIIDTINNEVANQVAWEAGKYYYLKTATQPYFVIDNARQKTENRQYYRFVDIFEEDYEYTLKKIPLEKIIRESVHAYAKEPYSNIVINDLEDYGLEQITYKGDKPLLVFRNRNTLHFSNMLFAEKMVGKTQGFNITVEENEVTFSNGFETDSLTHEVTNDRSTIVYLNKNHHIYSMAPIAGDTAIPYSIAVINYGDDLGYRVTDLTYPGDLVSNIGDSLTSVLDKIKTMLGDFEYFYNLDGQFVFQKKKTYVNTAWDQFIFNQDEKYVTYANDKRKFSFNFEGNRLISAVQNTPVLSNLKNDFVVWGKRIAVSGAEIPIHARYAIDKKPTEYMSLKGILYYTDEAEADPSDQYRDIILNGSGGSNAYTFTKNTSIIPQCLIDADPSLAGITNETQRRQRTLWYEIHDWAEYYYSLTGAYPAQRMSLYQQNGGFIGDITFPDERSYHFTGQLIIDFYRGDEYGNVVLDPNEFIPYYSVYPFQHTYNGCGHTYADFLNRHKSYPKMISFIYNPKIPNQEVIEADGGHYQPIMTKRVDWRELIYQMALDYFAGSGCSEKQPIYDVDGKLVINNPDHLLSEIAARNIDKYPTGYTGYEQYYTDMEGFWRQLYNPDYVPQIEYEAGYYEVQPKRLGNSAFYTKEKVWHTKKIKDIQFQYYVLADTPGYNVYQQVCDDNSLDSEARSAVESKSKYIVNTGINDGKAGWNIDVFERPESLNFWIEFLDEGEELQQFAIRQVGDRQKVVNEDKVSAIVFREVPDIILYDRFATDDNGNQIEVPDTSELRRKLEENTGYTWVYLPKGFSKYLTLSYRNISAKNKIDELLYQFAYCVENVSITALPVYHLEPNTRIYVCDKSTGIAGEYIVNKITLPLTYNGTMSITATLAPERLY